MNRRSFLASSVSATALAGGAGLGLRRSAGKPNLGTRSTMNSGSIQLRRGAAAQSIRRVPPHGMAARHESKRNHAHAASLK